MVAPVSPKTVSTRMIMEDEGYESTHGCPSQPQNYTEGPLHSRVSHSPLGMTTATVRVEKTMKAVMAINRFCGIGSLTWSSNDFLAKKRELMLTRQGKMIRGKLTTTDKEKPVIT